MKKVFATYLLPPIIIVALIWISTLAFDLISAPSNWKVAVGVLILVFLFAVAYRFIVVLIKSKK